MSFFKFQICLLAALLGLCLGAPAKLENIRTEYSYDPPAEPSDLYETPEEPSGLYETPEEPSGLYETPLESAPSNVQDTPIEPPSPPTTTTTTTTTPPPPPPKTYFPPEPVFESSPAENPEIVIQPMMDKSAMPYMPYDFNWGVDDDEYGTRYTHQERTDGNVVTGEYRVLMADGLTQIVEFSASPETGYVANVRYEKQTL